MITNTERKKLKFWINGESVERELTFEEMLSFYNNYCKRMLRNFSRKCYGKVQSVYENIMEEEDFYNEGLMRAYYCYENYKADKSFVSYLKEGLDWLWYDYGKTIFAQKRKSQLEMASFEYDVTTPSGVFLLYEVVGDDDKNLKETELKKDLQNAFKMLTKQEIRIAQYLLQEEITKNELAKELGISRPTLNTRIKLVQDKLSNMLSEYKPE